MIPPDLLIQTAGRNTEQRRQIGVQNHLPIANKVDRRRDRDGKRHHFIYESDWHHRPLDREPARRLSRGNPRAGKLTAEYIELEAQGLKKYLERAGIDREVQ